MRIGLFSENRSELLELATLGSMLTGRDQLYEISFYDDKSELSPCGNKIVLGLGEKGKDVNYTSRAISYIKEKYGFDVLIFSSSKLSSSLASLVSGMLKINCITDAYDVILDSNVIKAKRNVFAGKAYSLISCSLPCILTLKAGFYPKAEEKSCNVKHEQFSSQEFISVEEVREAVKSDVNLKNAKIIVSVGRGFKKKEDLNLALELANLLNAALGCSRPISSDLGWLPEEHHIGLTGVNVKPELYFAIGISGQLQHIAGIKDSRLVVAINIDKSAPIFQSCDYGAVGDLYKIVPELIQLIKGKQ